MRAGEVRWLGAVVLVVGCAQQPVSTDFERPALIGGRILDEDEPFNVPAVRIIDKLDPSKPDQIPNPRASGVLVGPNLVLTTAHKIDKADLSKLVVEHGADDTLTTANPVFLFPHKDFKKKRANGRVAIYPDLALLFLDGVLGVLDGADPAVEPPALGTIDCNPKPLLDRGETQVHCISGVFHTLIPGAVPPTVSLTPFMNDGVFRMKAAGHRHFVDYLPNTAPLQTFAPGDSGSGCFELSTSSVHAITQSIDNLPPDRATAKGTVLADFCDFFKPVIDENLRDHGLVPIDRISANVQALIRDRPPATANELHLDSDNKKDIARLARVDGDAMLLTLERTQVGDQSFPVTVPNADEISAITVGNFNGQGQSLAIIADGALRTISFNGGPQPSITGASATNYVTLTKARMNGGNIDDLVAQREDGEIDVFIGGSGGLQLNAAAKPEPLHLDDDALPDFAWLTGGAGISVSNSRFGQSFREVESAPGVHDIVLTDIRTGRFRRGSGAELGAEDVVVIGKDIAGGGVVISCESNGNGVICNPAIEARFSSTHDPIAIEVDEVSGDTLDDLIITYGDGTPQQILRGRPEGFPSLSTSNPEPKTAQKIVPLFNGGDLIAAEIAEDGGDIIVRTFDLDGNELAVVDTGIELLQPLLAAAANFNSDGVVASLALAAGESPLEDLAILSGGRVFSLMADGNGGFTVTTLDTPDDVVAIATNDVTGDGIDDLSATRADGSVSVFPGSPSGLGAAAENFTGLPTPDSNDGKMLLLSGLGVDTVGTTQMRMRLRVGPGDTAALDHLNVQVFDGNNGGLHQFEEETNLLKTCYRLSADPCGDGNSGNCAGGPIQPIPLVTVSSDALGDDKWDTLFNGPHSSQASLTGNGQAPFTYELRVYLSQDCATIPTQGSQLAVATADAFKIRSNAMVSQPLGEFSIIGSDSSGTLGVAQPYMPDTDYDGTFNLPISVGSSASEIQLKESDADDTQDSTLGVSLGANSEIQYRLLRPDGTAANLTGGENTTAAALVTNPSGNNDGQSALDVETRTHQISGSGAGVWTWQWENVKASNAIHLFSPFGSPTTHEVMGARRARPTLSTAQQPASWRSDATGVQAALPIVLGNEMADGEREGTGILIDNLTTAQAILDNTSNDLRGELERQLLTAKLNWQHGLALGEDIKGALVYGRTKAVRSVLREADNVVSGVDWLVDEASVADLVTLLSAINLGELNYQQPGVPFPEVPMADDDDDGIANLKDNCPSIHNPLQEDTDDDWIGDACHVAPVAVCVLERSETDREAVLGYDNPLSFRGVAQGAKNLLIYNGQPLWETAQPTELRGGAQLDAFRHPFAWGDTLSWTLDGETVTVSDATPSCSGRELTKVDLAPRTVLYGAESILIGERSRVTASGSGRSSIVSGGDVVLEASSSVENVLSAGRAVVGDYAAIRGAAATSGGVERATHAFVQELRSFAPRSHSLAWWVPFETQGVEDIAVSASQQRTLAAGDYGDVVVASRGQLLLSAGRYQFRSLVVLEQGSLRVADGEVVVHVQQRLQHAGDTRLTNAAELVIGYLGSEGAAISASLEATVVAPHAELTLGSVRQSVYIGSFAARSIVLRPETQVEYAGSDG